MEARDSREYESPDDESEFLTSRIHWIYLRLETQGF